MDRHCLILLILVCSHLLTLGSSSRDCKCTPSSSCWPSRAIWYAFNQSIHGRLLAPKPYAWPCHTPQYDPAACSTARALQNDPFYRGQVVGAMQSPNWESGMNSLGCPIEGNGSLSTPCYQGDVSVYAINVSSVSDIQAGVVFAARFNLRLVIKSSGHDWLGRSTAAGSLCIWLRHLTSVSSSDSFVPGNCPGSDPVPAVTTEPGVTWDFLYDYLRNRNRVVVGPSGSSVSTAGGFVLGGGHSPLSRTFGYGADNALQFKVVTADGCFRVVTDLFWALKGGGGGTFGVVVSVTYRTFPELSGYVFTRFYVNAADRSSLRGLVEKLAEVTPSMDEAGLAGYFYLDRSLLAISFHLPNGTISQARAAFAPLVAYVAQDPALVVVNNNVTFFATFVDYHDGFLCPLNPRVCTDRTGYQRVLATRLMPKSIFENSPGLVADALMQILFDRNSSSLLGLFTFGGAASSVEGRNNSLHSLWREAVWQVGLSRTWNDSTSLAERKRITVELSITNDILRNITPGGGSYKNEADYLEQDWQQAFFGEKYSMLKAIKESVDPGHLFLCWKCVGSENFVKGYC